MKITNRNQLPLVLVETLENDRYDSGRPEHCEHYVTITQLIRPAQLNYLSRQYADQLEYDVSDLVLPDRCLFDEWPTALNVI